MSFPERRLVQIAAEQHGSFSRGQAHTVGLTDRQLSRRVKTGVLTKVGPNAFRFSATPHSLRGDLTALLLDVGDPVWVAGPTAAALHGFSGFDLEPTFHLMIPNGRNVRRNHVSIHRTYLLDPGDFGERDGFAVTRPARTIIDMSRMVDYDTMLHAVGNAFERGQVHPSTLHRRIAALKSHHVMNLDLLASVLEELDSMGDTESWLEREYLRLCQLYGLPRPQTQRVLSSTAGSAIRVDCYFEHANVVVELYGYRFHRTIEQLERDTRRANQLAIEGKRVFQFSYSMVANRPLEVIQQTAAAIDWPFSDDLPRSG